jgi:hypothetical protein
LILGSLEQYIEPIPSVLLDWEQGVRAKIESAISDVLNREPEA